MRQGAVLMVVSVSVSIWPVLLFPLQAAASASFASSSSCSSLHPSKMTSVTAYPTAPSSGRSSGCPGSFCQCRPSWVASGRSLYSG